MDRRLREPIEQPLDRIPHEKALKILLLGACFVENALANGSRHVLETFGHESASR